MGGWAPAQCPNCISTLAKFMPNLLGGPEIERPDFISVKMVSSHLLVRRAADNLSSDLSSPNPEGHGSLSRMTQTDPGTLCVQHTCLVFHLVELRDLRSTVTLALESSFYSLLCFQGPSLPMTLACMQVNTFI